MIEETMVLTPAEREALEAERAKLIDQQKHELMEIIQANQLDPSKLHAIISQDLKKYKPDALELAFNEMQANDSPRQAIIAVKKLWHTKEGYLHLIRI